MAELDWYAPWDLVDFLKAHKKTYRTHAFTLFSPTTAFLLSLNHQIIIIILRVSACRRHVVKIS